MRLKFLLRFRDKFVDKTMFSLIKAMFETVSAFLLINLLICFSRAVCNYSSESDSRINCVCCDENKIFFDITLLNKKEG